MGTEAPGNEDKMNQKTIVLFLLVMLLVLMLLLLLLWVVVVVLLFLFILVGALLLLYWCCCCCCCCCLLTLVVVVVVDVVVCCLYCGANSPRLDFYSFQAHLTPLKTSNKNPRSKLRKAGQSLTRNLLLSFLRYRAIK